MPARRYLPKRTEASKQASGGQVIIIINCSLSLSVYVYLSKIRTSVLFVQLTRWTKGRLGRSKLWFLMLLLDHHLWMLGGRVSIRLLSLFVRLVFSIVIIHSSAMAHTSDLSLCIFDLSSTAQALMDRVFN